MTSSHGLLWVVTFVTSLLTLSLDAQGVQEGGTLRSLMRRRTVNRFQELEQIRAVLHGERVRDRHAAGGRQGMQQEHIGQRLCLAAMEIGRVVIDVEKRRNIESVGAEC